METMNTQELTGILKQLDESKDDVKKEQFAAGTCGVPHIKTVGAIIDIGRVVTHIALKQSEIRKDIAEVHNNNKLIYDLLRETKEGDQKKNDEQQTPPASPTVATFDLKNRKIIAPSWMNTILAAVAGAAVMGLGMYAVTKLFLEDKPTPRHHIEQPNTVKTP